MKHYCFAIYDDKAKAYLPPWFLPTMGMAQRAFADAVNDPGTAFSKHPADYTLFCLGTWDQASGKFELESAFVNVANGLHVKHSDVVDAFRENFAELRPNGSPAPAGEGV